MSVLVDHPAETVVSAYGEAFDPVGFERVGQLPGGAAAARALWVRCGL
jgi:hypothetical protein